MRCYSYVVYFHVGIKYLSAKNVLPLCFVSHVPLLLLMESSVHFWLLLHCVINIGNDVLI